jgi:hypothetical protein
MTPAESFVDSVVHTGLSAEDCKDVALKVRNGLIAGILGASPVPMLIEIADRSYGAMITVAETEPHFDGGPDCNLIEYLIIAGPTFGVNAPQTVGVESDQTQKGRGSQIAEKLNSVLLASLKYYPMCLVAHSSKPLCRKPLTKSCREPFADTVSGPAASVASLSG